MLLIFGSLERDVTGRFSPLMQVAEMAAMAGFSGKVRKSKAAAPKLGKRVSRKVVVAPQPAASELSDPSDDADDPDEDFGGDEAEMDEEVVGASSHPHSLDAVPDLWQAVQNTESTNVCCIGF